MIRRRTIIGATSLLVAVLLAGCAAESPSTPRDDATAGTSATPSSSAVPAPEPSASETTAVGLPDDCTDAYSAGLVSSLEQEGLPMNDPAVTMLSTQNAVLLEDLGTLPTLRCSWGGPGRVGITTNISIVDAGQSSAIEEELTQAGFGCEASSGATICEIEQRGVDLDDVEYVRGETHALKGPVWVSTSWLNHPLDGYVEDILTTLGA
ncbi:hypothetical protein [Microbacterium sp. P04]|uniref:hypothetical protein n=1 Tax=Microbacterium sp. P04 TaxID=3366947 RepID=UPI0037450FBC